MTEQIYNSDAYKQELESKIIEINQEYIVLDKTIFFFFFSRRRRATK